MNYTKTATSLQDQIVLLKSRGLQIKNIDFAIRYLSNISYYRLSAYFLSFQKYNDPSHAYMPWATIEKVVDLYVFDRELRLTLLDAIERIEVSFRCRIIYEYGMSHGSHWHEDQGHYSKGHADLLKLMKVELTRTKEVFIKHYTTKYTHPPNPPAWMTLEVLSFGQLSILYRNLKTSKEKKAVADHFGVDFTILESWVEHLAYIRNICAHHSRLWNRTMTVKATIPKNTQDLWIKTGPPKSDKLYLTLVIISYLLNRINSNSSFVGRIKALFAKHPQLNFHPMGITDNWSKDPFWNQSRLPLRQIARVRYYQARSLFISTNV